MQAIINFFQEHPYVFWGLVIFIILMLIIIYSSILGWCVHTVQNPDAGFFKKGIAVMLGFILFKKVLNYMNNNNK